MELLTENPALALGRRSPRRAGAGVEQRRRCAWTLPLVTGSERLIDDSPKPHVRGLLRWSTAAPAVALPSPEKPPPVAVISAYLGLFGGEHIPSGALKA